jgi:RNA polymerase sigma-70 factor (ECF subfamily)
LSLELEEQYDKIYKYCYFKVKNQQIAEDLTQETFLRFFSQNSYINRGKPLAYLYTIARNLCIDTFRKIEDLALNDEITSGKTMEELETSVVVKQAIETLPTDLQEIILLRYANDLPIHVIAGITGVSRFTIYRKVNNAIKALKLVLREEDFL